MPEKEPGAEVTERLEYLVRDAKKLIDERMERAKKLDDVRVRLGALQEKAAELGRGGHAKEALDAAGEELAALQEALQEEIFTISSEIRTLDKRIGRRTEEAERETQRVHAVARDMVRFNREAALEGLKLEFEAHKNVTVLGSGALVAFALVTANLFPNPDALGLLGWAYGLMAVSVAANSASMFYIAARLTAALSPVRDAVMSRGRRIAMGVIDGAAIGAFFGSLLFFVRFLITNLG